MEIEPLKIGILITRVKAEKKKDELVSMNDKYRPWLNGKDIDKKFFVSRNNDKCISGDVSIGLYIKDNWNNVEIDFIPPDEISDERLKNNHINFMIIYDLIESFHVDEPKVYKNFVETLEKADNIFPPIKYQKFINNKCSYIKYLEKTKKDVTIPTFCIMKDTFDKKSMELCLDDIIKLVTNLKWEKFIGKPVYGQESIDFIKFDNYNRQKIQKYIQKCFKDKKYPGIIFQKYIEGFDGDKPEIRMYFIGDKYEYSVITTDKNVMIPKCENGKKEVKNMTQLKNYAKKILGSLPEIEIQGVKLGKLLTRIDIACNYNFEKPWVVNEVEFVPSLYIEDISKIPEPLMGDRMVKLTLDLIKKSNKYEYVIKKPPNKTKM